ncbi:MAG: cell division protein ZapD [Gammaproteobacteria bacterium]
MTTQITYEFPLNERIRVFIRLEHLFLQFGHFLSGQTEWDKRAAFNALFDIIAILSRNDVKSELLKELERHAKVLNNIANNEGVDTEKVDQILGQLNLAGKKLYAASGKIGVHAMESDLFQSVAQRTTIPGGTCSFDLPEFHYWLEQDEVQQSKDLLRWSAPFQDIRGAIDMVLHFIRNSSLGKTEMAEAGFFQIALDRNQPYQLIRVSLDRALPYFAEISGGKHRCTIRFMAPSSDEKRPVQSTDDIPFELTCCLF